SRLLLLSVCALAALLGTHYAARLEGLPLSTSGIQKDLLPFLTQHCYACHGNGKKRGEISLDQYKDELSLQTDRKVWDSVIHMIRSGESPPPEGPRPTAKDVEKALQAIETALAKFDCTGVHNVGRVTIRRLNKAEYNNTIRDLVGVDFQPAADFP